jgi:molecular chaperone GrpE (heat shock protein)
MDEDQPAGAEIAASLAVLRESFDAKIRYDEAKERQIAALHEELQAHRRGLYQQIMRPVLTDLMGIYDDIAGEDDPGKNPLLDLVEETLLRYGVTTFTCEDDRVDRSRQQVIDVVTTSDRYSTGRSRVGCGPDSSWTARHCARNGYPLTNTRNS